MTPCGFFFGNYHWQPNVRTEVTELMGRIKHVAFFAVVLSFMDFYGTAIMVQLLSIWTERSTVRQGMFISVNRQVVIHLNLRLFLTLSCEFYVFTWFKLSSRSIEFQILGEFKFCICSMPYFNLFSSPITKKISPKKNIGEVSYCIFHLEMFHLRFWIHNNLAILYNVLKWSLRDPRWNKI